MLHELTNSALSELYQHQFSKRPHTLLMNSKLTPKAVRSDYLPGIDRLMIAEGNEFIVNHWRCDGVIPKRGNCETILRHFFRWFGDEKAASYFLDLLAFHVQNPGRKIRIAVLLTGKQGNGKSTILRIVSQLVGDSNFRTAVGMNVASRFNKQFGNIQVLAIEELMVSGRIEAYNDLKPIISDETFVGEEKSERRITVKSPRVVICTSNHIRPINLEKDDRRFAVFRSVLPKLSKSEAEELYRAIDTELGAFAAFLHDRDASKFNPDAAPMMTSAKEDIIIESQVPLVQILQEELQDGSGPFLRDVVRLENIMLWLKYNNVRLNGVVTKRRLADALRELGCESRETRVSGVTEKRWWIVRNIDRWAEATPSEIADHLQSPPTRED